MKLTSLAVITLLVLGCSSAFAASGSFSLGFLSYTGGLQYCDYEVVSYNDPFAAGTHNLTTVCGFPVDGVMVGLKASIPAIDAGLVPVTGALYSLADNTIDAQDEAYTGCQLDWATGKKAMAKHNPKWGWEYFISCAGGSDYVGNFGYLTTALGARTNNGVQKTSFGKAQGNAKNKQHLN